MVVMNDSRLNDTACNSISGNGPKYSTAHLAYHLSKYCIFFCFFFLFIIGLYSRLHFMLNVSNKVKCVFICWLHSMYIFLLSFPGEKIDLLSCLGEVLLLATSVSNMQRRTSQIYSHVLYAWKTMMMETISPSFFLATIHSVKHV